MNMNRNVLWIVAAVLAVALIALLMIPNRSGMQDAPLGGPAGDPAPATGGTDLPPLPPPLPDSASPPMTPPPGP